MGNYKREMIDGVLHITPVIPKKKLTVTIDADILAKTKQFAKSENRSTSNYVENVLNQHIKQKTHEEKKE